MRKPITRYEQAVYDLLLNNADSDGYINLTYKTVAEITVSLPISQQLVYRRLNTLRDKGYITWEKMYYIKIVENED